MYSHLNLHRWSEETDSEGHMRATTSQIQYNIDTLGIHTTIMSTPSTVHRILYTILMTNRISTR